jgi:hypothetical protein
VDRFLLGLPSLAGADGLGDGEYMDFDPKLPHNFQMAMVERDGSSTACTWSNRDCWIFPYSMLSKYIIVRKGEYYRLLGGVTSKGGWEDWIL